MTLPNGHPEEWAVLIDQICDAKRQEIVAGVDGFLFYDINILKNLDLLWKEMVPGKDNQLHVMRNDVKVKEQDLLNLPQGGVTRMGLTNNIAIGVLFIQSWIHGEGEIMKIN